MTKRAETILIVLIYVLSVFTSSMLAYFVCLFDFWRWANGCMAIAIPKLALCGMLIFWVPTYHFGLKGWLKMGIAFLCSGFIWLSIWTMVAMHYEITWWQLTILKMIIGVIVGGLYLYAYVGEWKRRRGD